MIVNKKYLYVFYKDRLIKISYFINLWSQNTILFLHWLGSSKSSFLGSLEYPFINKYTIVGFDFPWHGSSEYIKKFAVDDLVAIVDLVIKKLNLKNIFFVWHSLGWLVALLYLSRYNDWIKAFINVEGNLTEDDCWFSSYILSLGLSAFREKFWDNDAMFDLSASMVKYSNNVDLLNLFIWLSLPKLFVYWEQSDILYIKELENNGIQTRKISGSWHHPFDTNPSEFYYSLIQYIANNTNL